MGFDTEAAGLANEVPCLVVRGICDFTDSHGGDVWRKYAALSAGAYAREVLLILQPRHVDTMPSRAETVYQSK